jgi:hypothetical protein
MGIYSGPPSASDGLVLYLDAANSASYSGSGNTWYDLSGNSNKATFVDSPSFQSAPQLFFNFDGSNDYMTIVRSSSMSPTSGLTQEVWFNFSTIPNAAIFIGLQYGSSTNNTYALWMESSTIYGGVNTSGSFAAIGIGISNISGNKWHNFVHTYDGSAQRLYLDGVLLNSANITGSIQYDVNNTRVLVGADDNGSGYNNGAGYFHSGKINQIKIYNRALSSEEITRNYNSTKKRYFQEENIVTNGLVLHIDPSKPSSYTGSGNTVYDLSGSGNTGTLANGAAFSGLNGGVIVFDGTNDYMTIPHNSSQELTYITVSAWFNFPVIPVAGLGINKEGSFRLISGESYTTTAGGRIGGSWGTGVGAGSTTLISNKWYQIVMTADGTTQKLYVNGSLDYTTNNSALATINTNVISFATYHYGAGYFLNCKMTKIQLYNRALSAVEVQQNYNATKGRFGY